MNKIPPNDDEVLEGELLIDPEPGEELEPVGEFAKDEDPDNPPKLHDESLVDLLSNAYGESPQYGKDGLRSGNTIVQTGNPDKSGQYKHNYKRTPIQIEADYTFISAMYLKGYSQYEITEKLNAQRPYSLTRSQIAYDLGKIHARWREVYLADYNSAKARELARIDALERAYWEAWERSRENKKIVKTSKVEDEHTSGKQSKTNQKYSRVRVEQLDEKRDGDKDFLKGIQWCVEERAKILGLHVAQKMEISWRKKAEEAGIDPGALFNDMVGKFLDSPDGDASPMGGGDGESTDGGSLEEGELD